MSGDLLVFADSDDVVPPGAYAALLRQLNRTGSDFVAGSLARWEGDGAVEPPWMRRLHRQRMDIDIDDQPEILGDVFAWNKLFRTDFWRDTGLAWPEGVRYEDQPTTTLAYLRARRFGVCPRSSTTGGSAPTAPRSPSSGPRPRTCATAGRPS